MYHGTDKTFDDFSFKGIGVHFGTREQAEDRNASKFDYQKTRTITAVIDLKNPLRMEDVHLWQIPRFVIKGMLNTGLWAEKDLSHIPQGRGPSDDECEKGLALIREEIISKGFDSIVYSNTGEGKKSRDSYIAMQPSQVRILDHGRESLIGRSGQTPSQCPRQSILK